MKTIEDVITLHPDMVRLYPTIVINGTELARWYEEKRYHPLQFEVAVKICQESCVRLESKRIPVIRIGLMSSPSLLQEGQIVAGPWHEAFGFLVRSGICQKKIEHIGRNRRRRNSVQPRLPQLFGKIQQLKILS